MEGIKILAEENILDFGMGSILTIIIGILLVLLGLALISLDWEMIGTFMSGLGGAIIFLVIIYIFIPIKAYIVTIDDTVPYTYIEEHYRVKDKVDNLYTLIPKGDTTDE